MSLHKEDLSIPLSQIKKAILSLKYGKIHISVHDARVVQIEKIERIRLTAQSEAPHKTDSQPTVPPGGMAQDEMEL